MFAENYPYEVLEFLGKGSFGEVVKARHQPTNVEVAIKLLKNSCSCIYNAKKELSEINILRKFTEANQVFTTNIYDIIIPTMDTKSSDPIPCIFLVMELASTDLSQLVGNLETLEVEEDHSLIMMYNILCSINFMHTSNIIHRDIKPSNILLYDDCQVRICDFGLSRSLPHSVTQDSVK